MKSIKILILIDLMAINQAIYIKNDRFISKMTIFMTFWYKFDQIRQNPGHFQINSI